MTFEEAEIEFRKLESRMRRGGILNRAAYEEQVSQLAVQDEHGVCWEIHPRTAKWLYFDGKNWVEAIPPGRAKSAVTSATLPASRAGMHSSVATTASAQTDLPQRRSSPERLVSSLLPDRISGVPLRALRRTTFSDPTNRWVVLVMGVIILFACAGLLFFGGPLVLGTLGSQPTVTRTPVIALATITPIPTPVPLPTKPLPTVTIAPTAGKIIESRVNVRAAPNTQAEIVGKVQKDDPIILIGRSEDSAWYQVNIADRAEPAWIFAATMEITSGDPKTLPVIKSP